MISFRLFILESDDSEHKMLKYHLKHLKDYAETKSNAVNSKLRKQKGENRPFDKRIHALDYVTSERTKHDMVVHRGVSHKEAKHFAVGKHYVNHGYTSTTEDEGYARAYFTDRNKNNESHIMHIHVPKGTKAHSIKPEHGNSEFNEREHLIHRGATFHIHQHTYDPEDRVHHWHASVINRKE